MDLNHYQVLAAETAQYPTFCPAPIYPALGLAGESGEVAEKVKKLLRDHGGEIPEEKREDLKKEVGDCLWYVAIIARDLGYTLEQVAFANIMKPRDRKERGMIGGEGDNR